MLEKSKMDSKVWWPVESRALKSLVLLPLQYLATSQHAEHASTVWTRWIFLFPSSMTMETSPKPPSITAMDGVPLTEVPRRPNAGKIGLSSTRTVLHFCFASNWCKNQVQRRTPATANTETKARSDISSTTTPVNNDAPRLTLLPAAVLTASYSPFFRLLHLPRRRAYTNAIALIARTLNIIGAKILATYNHRL
jgi:hypothetical protein